MFTTKTLRQKEALSRLLPVYSVVRNIVSSCLDGSMFKVWKFNVECLTLNFICWMLHSSVYSVVKSFLPLRLRGSTLVFKCYCHKGTTARSITTTASLILFVPTPASVYPNPAEARWHLLRGETRWAAVWHSAAYFVWSTPPFFPSAPDHPQFS